MKYDKPFLSFEEQLARAASRGMHVSDPKSALCTLQRIGYYRLSAYWYHWRVTDVEGLLRDEYHPSASFEASVTLYSFDRQLRLILLDAIERIEVALRVAISNVAGSRHAFIHRSTEHLGEYAVRVDPATGLTPFATFIGRCNEAYDRSSEDFVKHFKTKYEDGPAIWVHVETWDFGLLSNFFKLLNDADKLEIAQYFGITHFSLLESWIASLNYVRNLCAHHSRLFRRTLVVRPGTKLMKHILDLDHVRHLNAQRSGKIYPVLAILILLMSEIAPESEWHIRLRQHVADFPSLATASLADYGFPDDWENHKIWRND